MKHQGVGFGFPQPVRHDHPPIALFRPADCSGPQPSGAAPLVHQANRLAPKECRHDRLYLVGIGDMPAGRRFVERDAEAHIPGGGYRRDAAGELGNAAGQPIGATMSPDQRHRYRAVLGDRDDRRLLPLGGEERGDRADEDAAGADTDDRPTCFEQLADMGRHSIVALVPVRGVCTRPVQPSAGQRHPQSAAERGAP